MDSTYKNIFVLGASGVGKSFLLNILLGSEMVFQTNTLKLANRMIHAL